MKSHIKSKHTDQSVFCPECSKKCNNKGALRKHIRIVHLNQINYVCDKCDKAFRSRKTMMEHITAVHDKLKPYICEQCPFACAKDGNLNIHRKKSHKSEDYLTKGKLITMVKNGEHPYYDDEKFQLLLDTNHH